MFAAQSGLGVAVNVFVAIVRATSVELSHMLLNCLCSVSIKSEGYCGVWLVLCGDATVVCIAPE
ncbi:hypothetical protein D3C81_1856630 [compost metagenome]